MTAEFKNGVSPSRRFSGWRGLFKLTGIFTLMVIGLIWYMVSWKGASIERRYCGETKSDLANLSLAEESYFIKHGAYLPASVGKGGTHPELNFTTYPHVSLEVEVGDRGGAPWYSARGYSELCPEIGGSFYSWDSSKGGLQPLGR